MSSYQAGYCNIGVRGRRRRLWYALASVAVAAGYALACLAGPLPEPLLLGVFVPLTVAFEWGIQAYSAFCVRLALLGRYDFRGDDGGDAGSVTAAGDRRADALQAARVTAVSLLAAGAVTLLLVTLL